jgi:hypothetical protein
VVVGAFANRAKAAESKDPYPHSRRSLLQGIRTET